MLVPRERVLVLRERVPVLRFAVVRDPVPPEDFAAPPLDRELLLAPDAREEPADDLARVDDALRPPVLDLARVEEDLRAPVLDFARPDDARDVLLRAPDDLVLVDPPEDPELAPPSLHLPDITRCAASATASAMIDPSLVALDMTLFAACDAVSAASSPASRIFRRAAGLALIAAAAAARPAASISLLIAALASLSTVSFPEPEDLEELFRADLAIAFSPCRAEIALRRNSSQLKCLSRAAPLKPQNADMLKGTAAYRSDALRHGQRPEMWPSVSDQSWRTPLSDLPAEP